jgi:hypothetical protein
MHGLIVKEGPLDGVCDVSIRQYVKFTDTSISPLALTLIIDSVLLGDVHKYAQSLRVKEQHIEHDIFDMAPGI